MDRAWKCRTTAASAFALLLAGCGGGSGGSAGGGSPSGKPGLGAISYWALTNQYDQLPSGALTVVNPSNGMLSGQTLDLSPDVPLYATIVTKAAARNVSMLGYVPTGYFNHACDINGRCQTWTRIEAQVQAYFQSLPGVAGIFFDETSMSPWNCSAFVAEFQQMRNIVHKYNAQAKIAFNVADPTPCVVDAVAAGEILVQFEDTAAVYLNRAAALDAGTAAARAKGVASWHLIFAASTAADLNSVFTQAATVRADLFYATDIAANAGLWNTLPAYWTQELALLGY